MIVRSGRAFSVPILFSSGHPDGNVTWRLLDETGDELTSGTAAVPSDAVSIQLPVEASYNTLSFFDLIGSRDLEWSYEVGGMVINGDLRYSVEPRAPYGASPDGVRTKLGLDTPSDLPDSEISLIRGYFTFRGLATADAILDQSDGGGPNDLAFRDAIEAATALALLPTMAVRIALSEDSGTNAYKRQPVDWAAIGAYLEGVLAAGVLIALPSYDPTAAFGVLFMLATPATDAITGSSTSA